MPDIIVIAHNIRSTHNIGSVFRTSEGFGVEMLILSGYTPYPKTENDARLPHIADKITGQIHKTALGAESLVPFVHYDTLNLACPELAGYRIVALEQAPGSINLRSYHRTEKIALLLGEEVHGIGPELLACVDDVIEIPMCGQKESFNVSVAAGIALYQLSI